MADKTRSNRALDALNFFMADISSGVGPFLVVYLSVQMQWSSDRIGTLMFAFSLVGVLAQTPIGGLVDRTNALQGLIGLAAILVGIGSAATILCGHFAAVLAAQSMVAIAGAVFGPAVAAISIGIVGRRNAETRFGRNQSINSAGNVLTAVAAGVAGHYFQPSAVFVLVAVLSVTVVASSAFIRNEDIDYQVARGADGGDDQEKNIPKVSGISSVLADRRLLIFAACAVLFHFANASMLMLIAQGGGKAAGDSLLVTAYVVISQMVMVPLGLLAGRYAKRLPRKPIFVVAFLVLPVRGVLFSLTSDAHWFAAIQILDGVGAGIFGVMQILVIADLTQGTGRFNLAEGAIGTAVGIGAACSQAAGGYIANRAGFPAAFLTMAAIAGFALALFWLKMPETRKTAAFKRQALSS